MCKSLNVFKITINALFICLFCFDRAVKHFVSARFFICNKGISFGLHIEKEYLVLVYVFFSFFLAFLAYRYRKEKNGNIIGLYGLMFVCFGAISNGVDRLIYGCVVDYIYIASFFPWFNIADTSIFFGACLLLWQEMRRE